MMKSIQLYLRLSSDEGVAIVMVRKWTDFSLAMQRFYDAQNTYISALIVFFYTIYDISSCDIF